MMAEAQSHSPPGGELSPDIILYNILPRLPAKSVLRFICVSKQWHSFLNTPSFQKLHLHHVTNDDQDSNHHKLLVLSRERRHLFNTIDCESPEDGLTASRSFPFEATSEHMYVRILTSFDGLVCVGINTNDPECPDNWDMDEYSDLILWNPLTSDYKTLSKANSHKDIYNGGAFGLYYSSCEDDYKLLCVTGCDGGYIYSLKYDAWRKLDSVKYLKVYDNWEGEDWWPGTPLNEKLYFLNYTMTMDEPLPNQVFYSIVRFDTKTEKFTQISIHPDPPSGVYCLISQRGYIHFYVIRRDYASEEDDSGCNVELWRMDEDGGRNELVTTYPNTNWFCGKPLHLMRDGNWLTHYDSKATSVASDFSGYKIELAPHIKNISFNTLGVDIPPEGKYIETLVSPNRYL